MEKHGVQAEVYRAGEFKGAVEPLWREGFSRENRQQIRDVLDAFYDHYITTVSSVRGVSPGELRTLSEGAQLQMAEGALAEGLADAVVYPADHKASRDEFFCRALGLEDEDGKDIAYVKVSTYDQAFGDIEGWRVRHEPNCNSGGRG